MTKPRAIVAPRAIRASAASALLLLVVAASDARGALPTAYGGSLRLPAPEPITPIDPLTATTPFAAMLAGAVYDGLYAVADDGSIVPALAEGAPAVEGDLARVRLRPGIVRHDRRPLRAADVVASLRRAAASPRAAWLFGALAARGGAPDLRAVDDTTIELRLARPGLDVARILAAAPLAIVIGDPARRAIGTGAFAARPAADGTGELRLVAFASAPLAPPFLADVRVVSARAREDELRAFELGELDASWHGTSLYGGQPVRAAASSTLPNAFPVLLVPNRAAGPLLEDATWFALARAIDRRRLERVGLAASARLASGLPAPRTSAGRRPRERMRLRMAVPAGDPFAGRLAEALAGILDEAGFALAVERVAPEALARGDADLRIETIAPPLPGPTPLAAAALAATGDDRAARALAAGDLGDASAAAAAAQALRSVVLGHRRDVLYHRADLLGVRFDALGRLVLGDVALARTARGDP